MAGLVVEMILNLPEDKRPEFEVIAGVSAVNAAAAILGAPLMNDFAVISLSDLMTPFEVIKRRVRAAAQGGALRLDGRHHALQGVMLRQDRSH